VVVDSTVVCGETASLSNTTKGVLLAPGEEFLTHSLENEGVFVFVLILSMMEAFPPHDDAGFFHHRIGEKRTQ